MRVSSFKIRFKRNSQFKKEFFIRKDENIRMLVGAECVRGYGRARRRHAVRNVSEDLSRIIRFRVSRAESKYKMFQNRVMLPGIASL